MAARGSVVIKSFQLELGKFRHALDYAPGMDYPNIDTDVWSDLTKASNDLGESLLKAKKYAQCIERATDAKNAEDVSSTGRKNKDFYKLVMACKRKIM